MYFAQLSQCDKNIYLFRGIVQKRLFMVWCQDVLSKENYRKKVKWGSRREGGEHWEVGASQPIITKQNMHQLSGVPIVHPPPLCMASLFDTIRLASAPHLAMLPRFATWTVKWPISRLMSVAAQSWVTPVVACTQNRGSLFVSCIDWSCLPLIRGFERKNTYLLWLTYAGHSISIDFYPFTRKQ